jgi:NAD(P)-dependent dehydrogenase (short-subunit alcohol dehydrogenase family)
MDSNEKWIVITGASGGIGYAAAARMLKSGYNIVASGRNSSALEDKFSKYGERAVVAPFDLNELDSIEDFAAGIVEKVGALHGLFVASGLNYVMPLSMMKPSALQDVFRINTFAPMLLVKAFIRKKRMCEGASIVLMSSIAASEGSPAQSVYSASKAAIEGFAHTSAIELGDRGIRINCIAPAAVDTDMLRVLHDSLNEEQLKREESYYRFGFGKPEYVAGIVEYLFSEDGKWVSGQTFKLDGGRVNRK